ncbi:MAG: two-component system sensor histidine kinase NtrB [Gemmatimonadales bacterium]
MSGGEQGSLRLLASIAKLLSAGLRIEPTLEAVTEALRVGIPARQVTLWFRGPGATVFRAVSAPALPRSGMALDSLDGMPHQPSLHQVPLEQDGVRLGLLTARLDGGAGLDVLQIVADFLTPYVASSELSTDLAGEVAAQSREIEENRRFTSLIIDTLPLGLYVVDRDYRIQTWNRKRETGTQGLRREVVVGRRIFDVLTRQDPERLRTELDRVFQTGEIQQSTLEVGLGDQSRFYRLSKIPMRLDGDEITHVITIGEDVTDWHGIQARIMQSEKLAAIGQLAAGVMHEINNPLATISACVAAIQGRLEPLSPGVASPVAEYLEIIDKEVDRCSGIVDGLLDFSRPKSKAKAAVSLNALVADALSLLRHHQRFKRFQVVERLDPELPAVTGNAEQLTQVLMALMLNAMDAMEQSGQLTLSTGRDRLRPEDIVLEVQDTGIGIPRDEQSKIFEPFYTTKPPGRGTGLGLSICYGIVEDHRGRIEVDSAPGRGATFRVRLPARQA